MIPTYESCTLNWTIPYTNILIALPTRQYNVFRSIFTWHHRANLFSIWWRSIFADRDSRFCIVVALGFFVRDLNDIFSSTLWLPLVDGFGPNELYAWCFLIFCSWSHWTSWFRVELLLFICFTASSGIVFIGICVLCVVALRVASTIDLLNKGTEWHL